MSALINPYTVIGATGLVFILLSWKTPSTARVVLGVFFLLMALAVNLPLVIAQPGTYVELGRHALLPFYRWAFTELVALNPRLFVAPIILYQVSVGLLILSQGRAVRLGLLGGIAFCLAVTPVGMEELTAPIIAIALAMLLRREFPQPVWSRLTRGQGRASARPA